MLRVLSNLQDQLHLYMYRLAQLHNNMVSLGTLLHKQNIRVKCILYMDVLTLWEEPYCP